MLVHHDSIAWLLNPVKPLAEGSAQNARARQNQLTKPPGSLGRLESLAIQFAAWQEKACPSLETIGLRIFAGDHGVCAQGVSAFPQVVTAQMLENFARGGAAISVLSRSLNADFAAINVGVKHAEQLNAKRDVLEPRTSRLINLPIAKGTKDFSQEKAMTETQLCQAINSGKCVVENQQWDVYIGGEMGIGNTTSAAAIFSALLNLSPEQTAGPGTGISEDGVKLKQKVIASALALHSEELGDPLKVLQCLGGFEIAALAGSYIYCAQIGIPIIIDGFIATAAALVAIHLNADAKKWMLFSHCSAETAHRLVLDKMEVKAILDLEMRLGEGSGAALVVPLIQSALVLHNSMATFSQAAVSEK